MRYKIEYLEEVVKKHIPSLSSPIKLILKKAIEEKLMLDPVGYGAPLRYSLKGHRKLRVGDYRIVYRIIPENMTVLIIAIGHRKLIYKKFS